MFPDRYSRRKFIFIDVFGLSFNMYVNAINNNKNIYAKKETYNSKTIKWFCELLLLTNDTLVHLMYKVTRNLLRNESEIASHSEADSYKPWNQFQKSLKKCDENYSWDEQTNGLTNGRTNCRMDGRNDTQRLNSILPLFLFKQRYKRKDGHRMTNNDITVTVTFHSYIVNLTL